MRIVSGDSLPAGLNLILSPWGWSREAWLHFVTAESPCSMASGMPAVLPLEQMGHLNLRISSGDTHFDDAFRQPMAWTKRCSRRGIRTNGAKCSDFPSTGRLI